jgi:hypothetical protein
MTNHFQTAVTSKQLIALSSSDPVVSRSHQLFKISLIGSFAALILKDMSFSNCTILFGKTVREWGSRGCKLKRAIRGAGVHSLRWTVTQKHFLKKHFLVHTKLPF